MSNLPFVHHFLNSVVRYRGDLGPKAHGRPLIFRTEREDYREFPLYSDHEKVVGLLMGEMRKTPEKKCFFLFLKIHSVASCPLL
jgi:hypothetical protein